MDFHFFNNDIINIYIWNKKSTKHFIFLVQKNLFGVLCATSSIEDGIVISITFFPFLYWPSPVYIDHRQLFVHIFEIPGFAKDFYIHSTLSDLDYIDFMMMSYDIFSFCLFELKQQEKMISLIFSTNSLPITGIQCPMNNEARVILRITSEIC